MSKFDIWPKFECQNRTSNVKMRYSAWIRMSKYDFEYQSEIFGPNSNVKIWFRMSKCDIRHKLNDKIGYRMSICYIWPKFAGQNRISNVKMWNSARIRTVKQGFELSKWDIRLEFERSSDIRAQIECKSRISNGKMRHSAPIKSHNRVSNVEMQNKDRIRKSNRI